MNHIEHSRIYPDLLARKWANRIRKTLRALFWVAFAVLFALTFIPFGI